MAGLLNQNESGYPEEARKHPSALPTPHVRETWWGDQDPIPSKSCGWIEFIPTKILPSFPVSHDLPPSLPSSISQEAHIGTPSLRSTLSATDFSPRDIAISEQQTWIIPIIPLSPHAPKEASGHTTEQGYLATIYTLLKSSGIYALSSLASPLLSLVLAPLLTRYLSHSGYGALVILNTFLALIVGVTQLGIADAFFKSYSHDARTEEERRAVLSTLILLLSGISIPVALLVAVTAPWTAVLLLNDPTFSDCIQIMALILLLQNLAVPGLVWLRAESRALLFSLLSLCNLLINGAVTIDLVVFLHFGVPGSLLGTACGYAVVAVGTLPALLLRTGLRLRLNIARDLLTVGTPHVINLLSGWVLQLIDRYLLGHLSSLSLAASYSVAYSLGGILSAVVITPFSMAWWVMIYSIDKQKNAVRIFQLIFRWFSTLLLFAAFAFSLVGISTLHILFPPTYASVAQVIPIIALSTMFSGIYVVFCLGISFYGKTWITSITVTSAAALNVISNLLLIPHFGAMGAAIATLLSYILLVILAYLVNRRLYPVPFEVGLFSSALLAGVGIYIGSDWMAQGQPSLLAYSIHVGALLLYGGLLLLMLLLRTKGDRK